MIFFSGSLSRQKQSLFHILSKCSHLLSPCARELTTSLMQPSILEELCLWVSSSIFREEICPSRHPHNNPSSVSGPHRTRPFTLPQYPFRYLQAETLTIPSILGFHGDRGHVCLVYLHVLTPYTVLAPEKKPVTYLLVEWSKLLFSRLSISSSFNCTSKNLVSSLFSILFPHHASMLIFQKLNFCFYQRMGCWFLQLDKSSNIPPTSSLLLYSST